MRGNTVITGIMRPPYYSPARCYASPGPKPCTC